ncbi:MAG: motility associated factor glycosyltransferase family protein [Bacillota bacterium]
MIDNSKVLHNKVVFLQGTVNIPDAVLLDGNKGFPTVAINSKKGMVHLHSKFYPEKEAGMYWENKLHSYELSDLVIFIGFGLGYHIKELLRIHPDSKIVALELHPEIWDMAVHNIDLSYLSKAKLFLALVGGDAESIRFALLKTFNDLRTHGAMKNIKVYIHPVFEQYVEGYAEILQGVRMAISGFAGSLGTQYNTTEEWHENNIENLKYAIKAPIFNISPSIFIGCPVIVIGAGPSLMDNMEILKQIYIDKSAILVAAGTAYPALVKNGICPHFLGTVDATLLNWELLNVKEYQEKHGETILLFDTITHPWILRDFKGELAWGFCESNPWAGLYKNCCQKGYPLPAVASVSTYLFALAIKLGCSPIVMVGNDYAYQSDGVRYAADTLADHKMDKEPLYAGEWTKNYAGEKVFSPYDYSPAKFYISLLSQGVRGIELYNAAYRGAVIEGMPYRDLGELSELFKKKNLKLDIDFVKSKIKEISPAPKESIDFASALLKEIVRFEERLAVCRKGKNEKETIRLAEDFLYERDGGLIEKKIWPIVHSFKTNGITEYLAEKKQRVNFITICQLVTEKTKKNIENIIKDLQENTANGE